MSRSGVLATALIGGIVSLWGGAGHAGCDGSTDPCEISSGEYHISLPENPQQQPVPVVVFLHGYGGSGAGTMKNTRMVEALKSRGYAVIAPNATLRRNGNRSWVFDPGWEGRDEPAFLREVMADASDRFGVSQQDTILAGFSAGAFMVNYLACAHPDDFAAYAPVAGGFWRPQPESCAGPVRLFHAHGWGDKTVPLEGRYLGDKQFQQGDIYAGLELWRQTNGCDTHAPNKTWQDQNNLRRRWDCGEGADIEFMLFPGGHTVPKGWSDVMLDWFEAGM
ncbi:polyhydroxybutyrate depolymerase [Sedimentitalea sp. CY04]|uniref:Polyhydroxybutyrate depolymerase n=1 Tax=Parasedimentitalea denitrificans TaxID=2211118 RepID=A0ABX0W3L8_9RHOB|nr:alpha/beta fold hydrolase [Sedimentitalea sp. CY04]NIZ59943.1 polyhydroxybutyrate depolymerase [Sedimentitalea sp. CY04]